MITPRDLNWWLQTAEQLEWTFAKTYARTAPHDYVVLGRCPLSRADIIRAAKVIHTFGEPGKYWDTTNIYLTSPDRRWKWWTMDRDLNTTTLVNRATTDLTYGVQDTPRTYTPEFTEYDAIATDYDATRDSSQDETVRQRILGHFVGGQPASVLDVGCGTGALLDMGAVDPSAYTGIDPSQAMLNALVSKHPRVARVIPSCFEDAEDLAEGYDLVVAMDVPILDAARLRRLARSLLITTSPDQLRVFVTRGQSSVPRDTISNTASDQKGRNTMSDLGRLFQLRESENAGPLERFTTEALAIAIDHDPRPMVSALLTMDWTGAESSGWPTGLRDVSTLHAQTQRTLWDDNGAVGYLDLILLPEADAQHLGEIWVEVKVNAWIHGDQLSVYREHAQQKSPHATLITLGRTPIDAELPALTWNQISDAVDATPDAHPFWLSLTEFLTERHIASLPAPDVDNPAAATEVIVAINRIILDLWNPKSRKFAWVKEAALRNGMRAGNRLNTTTGPIEFGLSQTNAGTRWVIALRTKNWQRVTLDRSVMLRDAELAGLPAEWIRHDHGPFVLSRSAAPADFATDDEVTAWFRASLQDIKDAGLLNDYLAALPDD